jgi:hypothetical protein
VAESRGRFLPDILGLLFLLILGDCLSTYLCLTSPVPEGWQVTEVNLISVWMFENWGLVPGLIVFATVKGIALYLMYHWVMTWPLWAYRLWTLIMVGAVILTALVNYNNWSIYAVLSQQ